MSWIWRPKEIWFYNIYITSNANFIFEYTCYIWKMLKRGNKRENLFKGSSQ